MLVTFTHIYSQRISEIQRLRNALRLIRSVENMTNLSPHRRVLSLAGDWAFQALESDSCSNGYDSSLVVRGVFTGAEITRSFRLNVTF